MGKSRQGGRADLSLGRGAQESLWPCRHANTYAHADSHTYFNPHSDSYSYSDTNEHADPDTYSDAVTVGNMEYIFEKKMNYIISGVAQSLVW